MRAGNLFILSFLLFGHHGNCQDEFNWSRFDTLFLNEDSVQGFANSFSEVQRIGKINKSDALFELRYYVPPRRGMSDPVMYQILFTTDHKIEKYAYLLDRTGKYNIKNGIELMGKSGKNAIYRKKLESQRVQEDVLVYNSIATGELLNLQDQKSFIDALKNKQIVYSRCNNPVVKNSDCSDEFYLIEINSKGQYRNFRISEQASDYRYYNPSVGLMQSYNKLSELIKEIFTAQYFTF